MCAMQVARSKHGGKLKKDSHDFLNLYHAPPEMKYISRRPRLRASKDYDEHLI